MLYNHDGGFTCFPAAMFARCTFRGFDSPDIV